MKLALFLLLVGVCSAVDLRTQEEMADYINSLGTTWKAGVNSRFVGESLESITKLMGVKRDGKKSPLPMKPKVLIDDSAIPATFDSRTNWPKCAKSLNEIRDQSACGSCWAVAAVAAMTDRICIGSDGAKQIHVSADDLLTCCTECGDGCQGGYLGPAWDHWMEVGLVSGGNYTSKTGCKPYRFPPCEHHTDGTHFPKCPHKTYATGHCKHSCQSDYHVNYKDDKSHGKSSYHVSREVSQIQTDIMTHGPVEVAFNVYADFLTYKSGVYQHKSGGFLGGHAVKMLGWGTEDGTPYWLIANSWNSDWGDKGYFKILRGDDECGIEDDVTAGLARV